LRLHEPAFETLGIAAPSGEDLGTSLSFFLLTPFEYWLPAALVDEESATRGATVADDVEAERRMAKAAEALADLVAPHGKGDLRSAVVGIARRLVWPRAEGAAASASSVFGKTGMPPL
jgi:hypothetical protein